MYIPFDWEGSNPSLPSPPLLYTVWHWHSGLGVIVKVVLDTFTMMERITKIWLQLRFEKSSNPVTSICINFVQGDKQGPNPWPQKVLYPLNEVGGGSFHKIGYVILKKNMREWKSYEDDASDNALISIGKSHWHLNMVHTLFAKNPMLFKF